VFDRVDVSRTWSQCVKAFPGFDELRPNCQAALVSLVFNRGASMVGNNRIEMRAIRDLTAKRDYDGIAGELRAMVRVWRGTDIYEGMYRRRYAEAQLVMTP
jgi:GH24 family phage-related lysozyme (muramidase)